MTDYASGGVYILTSDPVSSLLIYLPADFGEEICAIDEADSGLDFSSQTLAAGCTPSGAIIQVTERAVHLGTIGDPSSNSRFDYDLTQSVAAAAVNDAAALAATVLRTQQGTYIHLMEITSSENQLQVSDIGERIEINYEPVSISIERFGFSCFVIIGTGSGKILVYRVLEETFTFVADIDVDIDKGDDISRAIESLAVIHLETDGLLEKSILFCGLRGGILVSFGMTIESDNSDSPISKLFFSSWVVLSQLIQSVL